MAGSNIPIDPWCPFCKQTVAKPKDQVNRKINEFTSGKCQCGAFYSCDPTGYNVGAAMVEAIAGACNDDWDLAWELLPDEDYLTGRIEDYDEKTNQVVETKNLDGRKVNGVLYFVRLHNDLSAIAHRKQSQNAGESPPAPSAGTVIIEPAKDPKRVKKRASKASVQKMVQDQDIDGLVDLVFDDLRTLRFLQRLLYTPDEELLWKTIHSIGKVCARFSTRQPGQVSDLLHRLFAACSDSASSSWGAIETIGAIIAERPDILGAFATHIPQYFDDASRQAPVLWALGSIAKARPDIIRKTPFYNIIPFLSHEDPTIRGLALRLFGRIHLQEAESRIAALIDDTAALTIYEDGVAIETTVSEQAATALNLITQEGER